MYAWTVAWKTLKLITPTWRGHRTQFNSDGFMNHFDWLILTICWSWALLVLNFKQLSLFFFKNLPPNDYFQVVMNHTPVVPVLFWWPPLSRISIFLLNWNCAGGYRGNNCIQKQKQRASEPLRSWRRHKASERWLPGLLPSVVNSLILHPQEAPAWQKPLQR